jgi:hypothetical protein
MDIRDLTSQQRVVSKMKTLMINIVATYNDWYLFINVVNSSVYSKKAVHLEAPCPI